MPPVTTAPKGRFSYRVQAGLSSSTVRKVFKKVADAVYPRRPCLCCCSLLKQAHLRAWLRGGSAGASEQELEGHTLVFCCGDTFLREEGACSQGGVSPACCN